MDYMKSYKIKQKNRLQETYGIIQPNHLPEHGLTSKFHQVCPIAVY